MCLRVAAKRRQHKSHEQTTVSIDLFGAGLGGGENAQNVRNVGIVVTVASFLPIGVRKIM